MLLIEMLLVLQEVQFPDWFLPYHTPYEIVATMHRLFPAYMNGCRCVTGAFYYSKKDTRVKVLKELCDAAKDANLKVSNMVFAMEDSVRSKLLLDQEDEVEAEEDADIVSVYENDDASSTVSVSSKKTVSNPNKSKKTSSNAVEGAMEKYLKEVRKRVLATREGRNGTAAKHIKETTEIIHDHNKLFKLLGADKHSENLTMLRNLVVYIAMRFLFIKQKVH